VKLTVTTHEKLAEQDLAFWRKHTPEERLNEVERLRIEAGKFLYEYPSRLPRIVKVTPRIRDSADIEELFQQDDEILDP